MFLNDKKNKKNLLTRKEIDKDKQVELEKGDFLAMMLALSFYIIPAVLGIFTLIALIIWIIY